MKFLIKYFILIYFFGNYIFAQNNTTGGILELYLRTMNSAGNTLTVRLDTRSTVWDRYLSITNNQDIKYSDQTVVGNYTDFLKGWHFVGSPGPGNPIVGYGFYKVSNNLNNSIFYLDFRDCEWGDANSSSYAGRIFDIYLTYDGSIGKFSYTANNADYYLINNGDVLKIWEIKDKVPIEINVTNGFQSYNANNLSIYSTNNNPKLHLGNKS